MMNISTAQISEQDLVAIRELEERIGNGIRLVAVEKTGSLYVIEAKTAPNLWERVDRFYASIGNFKAYYQNQEDAHEAKAALKSLLNTPKYKTIKKPVRLRKVA